MTRPLARSRGFTIPELIVGLALLEIVGGLLIPNLIEARKSGNELAAIGDARMISDAQARFRADDADGDGIDDYAASLEELAAVGLVDALLGSGQKQGYLFSMVRNSGGIGFEWNATAEPVSHGKSGDRSFHVDETGVIRVCPPGTKPVITARGEVECEPLATTGNVAVGSKEFVAAAAELHLLSAGDVLAEARRLAADPAFAMEALNGLDANADGRLDFDEALDAGRLVALARGLARSGSPAAGDDAELERILAGLSSRVRSGLALGVANEVELPAVQRACVADDHPAALLELVPEPTPFASIHVLAALVDRLDPEPAPAGDMTGSTRRINERRMAVLAALVAGMPADLRFGRTAALVRDLHRVRHHVSGRAGGADAWVAGDAALAIAARVDATLALVH